MKQTYKQAGVDIAAGDAASKKAYALAQSTFRSEVSLIHGVPGFGAKFSGYTDPYLLGATDGVGTKIKLAFETGNHSTIGIDLVAMCVNDLARRGADPLMFFPYIAIQKMDPTVTEQIMSGIVEGCKQAGCAILGGETAEMSDLYQEGEYDLAGTAIGVVEKDAIVTGEQIQKGDILMALPSSGLHSNGYTLARKVLLSRYEASDTVPELGSIPLGDVLLTPTRIYVKEIQQVLSKGIPVHGIAHITGGGIPGKLGVIIPEGLTAHISTKTWTPHSVFPLIQKEGEIEIDEMFRTFNMGLGMILAVPRSEEKNVRSVLPESITVGEVRESKTKKSTVLRS